MAGEGRWEVDEGRFYRASIGTGVALGDDLALFTSYRYVRDTAAQAAASFARKDSSS